jgi:hypothetical protein
MTEVYVCDRIFRNISTKSYVVWDFFAFFEVPSIR